MDILEILSNYKIPEELSSMIISLRKAEEDKLISEEELRETQELST